MNSHDETPSLVSHAIEQWKLLVLAVLAGVVAILLSTQQGAGFSTVWFVAFTLVLVLYAFRKTETVIRWRKRSGW